MYQNFSLLYTIILLIVRCLCDGLYFNMIGLILFVIFILIIVSNWNDGLKD